LIHSIPKIKKEHKIIEILYYAMIFGKTQVISKELQIINGIHSSDKLTLST